jgi:hypothetical protein
VREGVIEKEKEEKTKKKSRERGGDRKRKESFSYENKRVFELRTKTSNCFVGG